MDKGCMEGVTSLQEYFDNFGYLVNLCEMDDAKKKEKEKGGVLFRLNKKMNTNLGFVRENMDKIVDLPKEALGLDRDILKKVTEDCFQCLSSDEDGNSFIDLTKNDNWNANRNIFIEKCNRGDQDPMLTRYTPLPLG
jgi:hypothetical protein